MGYQQPARPAAVRAPLRRPITAAPGWRISRVSPRHPGKALPALAGAEISDAAVAASARQAADFWRLREGVAEVQRHEGASIKNDVALPVSAVPAFVVEAGAAVQAACPGLRVCAFGHIGDGNQHFNLSPPPAHTAQQFLGQWETLTGLVNAVVARHRGSISVEHGIGPLKRDALAQHEPAVAIDLMRRVKAALDPQGRLNPGELLPPTQE